MGGKRLGGAEPPDTMEKLEGDFRRAQERRRDLASQIQRLDEAK